MTKEENKLWYQFLKAYPIRFKRQYQVGNYIVDFYCYQAKLIVELDGSQHCEPKAVEYDKIRTQYLSDQGYLVVRISNLDVMKDFQAVCEYIERIARKRLKEDPHPALRATFSQEKVFTGGNMKTVTLYTDGACSGNPGPGGWGAILEFQGNQKELSGGEPETTNNRMELTAVIQGLKALNQSCIVELYSDSKYVIDGLQKGWAVSWRSRGWKKADKKPALNPDLWAELLDLVAQHEVRYHWVKGHADNPMNNRCDALAVSYYKENFR